MCQADAKSGSIAFQIELVKHKPDIDPAEYGGGTCGIPRRCTAGAQHCSESACTCSPVSALFYCYLLVCLYRLWSYVEEHLARKGDVAPLLFVGRMPVK